MLERVREVPRGRRAWFRVCPALCLPAVVGPVPDCCLVKGRVGEGRNRVPLKQHRTRRECSLPEAGSSGRTSGNVKTAMGPCALNVPVHSLVLECA